MPAEHALGCFISLYNVQNRIIDYSLQIHFFQFSPNFINSCYQPSCSGCFNLDSWFVSCSYVLHPIHLVRSVGSPFKTYPESDHFFFISLLWKLNSDSSLSFALTIQIASQMVFLPPSWLLLQRIVYTATKVIFRKCNNTLFPLVMGMHAHIHKYFWLKPPRNFPLKPEQISNFWWYLCLSSLPHFLCLFCFSPSGLPFVSRICHICS